MYILYRPLVKLHFNDWKLSDYYIIIVLLQQYGDSA